MGFIKGPNLPSSKVRVVLMDGRIDGSRESKLEELGISIIRIPQNPRMYDAVSAHPDMFFHHLGGDRIVHAPDVDEGVLKTLSVLGFKLVQGSTELSANYPFNIAYNAARVGNYVFHNFKYTDRILLQELECLNLKLIQVNQGYAKCSIAVVDSNSIITADNGIAREAEKAGLGVLLIQPENGILLPGLDMGFIGGSTGLIDKDKLAFTGDLKNLKSEAAIVEFLERRNIKAVSLSKDTVIDVGSILPIIED